MLGAARHLLQRVTARRLAATLAARGSGSPRSPGMPPKFYGVKVGVQPGVYTTWEECKRQVRVAKRLWAVTAVAVKHRAA